MEKHDALHFVKSVGIWSFSDPYFPAFGLNTERYSVSLRILSKCGKMRSRKTPNMNTFHAVCFSQFFWKSVIILTDVRKILIYNLLKYLKASSTFSSNKPYFSSNELILKLDTSCLTYHQIIPQIWRRLLLCSINVLTSTFSKC